MATLRWDRLLETCYRQDGTDVLVTPGSPPLVRVKGSWRALQIPPVASTDIPLLAAEGINVSSYRETDGFAYSDFTYRNAATFRVMAFGYPATTSLLIARLPSAV